MVMVGQIIIDQFISSGEAKWLRQTGITLLLPHGYDGQGPEHSSARLERFLQMCDDNPNVIPDMNRETRKQIQSSNMQVVNITTPANYFHCLRRQVLRPWRKPLFVMSPKSLLRHPKAVSSLDELADGSFQRVIADTAQLDRAKVRRILLVSGKAYYDLEARRSADEVDDIAIVRLEQLYPLQEADLGRALEGYPKDSEVVWFQEEPANNGAWPHLHLRFERELCGHPLRAITRYASASPATGSAKAHKLVQERLVNKAFD